MSLDWSIERVANYKTRCWKPEAEITSRAQSRLANDTNALIWGAMLLDLGSITEKNVDEWEWRIQFCKEIGENWMDPSDYYVDRAAIVDHVGLRTNVSTKTRSQWVRRMCKKFERRADEATRRDAERRRNALVDPSVPGRDPTSCHDDNAAPAPNGATS